MFRPNFSMSGKNGRIVVSSFQAEVKPYNIGRNKNGLIIPNLYRWGATGNIKAITGSKEWLFPCLHLNGRTVEFGGNYRIGTGWAAFVNEMRLEAGDILEFVLASLDVLDAPDKIPVYLVTHLRDEVVVV